MKLKYLLISIFLLEGMTAFSQVHDSLFVKPKAKSQVGKPMCKPVENHGEFRGPEAYSSVTNMISEEVTYAHYDMQSPNNYTVINNEELYGGVYLDGYLYAYDIYEGFQWFNKIDPFTGEILWWNGSTYYQKEMTYDYTTATAYGTYNNEFFTVNLATGDVTKIGDFPTDDPIYVLACALDGTLYAISGGTSSALYIVDKQTANLSMVGYTGIDEDYVVYYLQSGGFDYNTGILYWCEYETDTWMYVYDYSCIRTVDLATGHSTEIASTPDISQLCFFIPYDDPNQKENASNLSGEYFYNEDLSSATIELSWEMESTNTIQSINVYRGTNLEEIEIINTLPKNITTYTDAGLEIGSYFYQLKVVYNNGLESVPAKTVNGEDYLSFDFSEITENQSVDVIVYPSISHSFINVSCVGMKNVEVISVDGKVIQHIDTECDDIQIDINDFSAGIYFLKIETTEGFATKKIIKG